MNDIAYQVARVEGYPRFSYMFENGATTIWERWENLTGDGMNLHNHPLLASFTDWFYREIGRIHHCPDIAGDLVTIRPDYLLSLEYASCTYSGVKGNIEVKWVKQKNLERDVTISWNKTGSCSSEHSQWKMVFGVQPEDW